MSVPPELIAAARTAPFVFFGTVRRPGGSTVEMLDTDEYPTAVVRIDESITAPEALGDLTGREVTVHLMSDERLARGSRHLFVATSLQFGNEIAVAELARVPHQRRIEKELRGAVLDARLREQEDALSERLRQASAV